MTFKYNIGQEVYLKTDPDQLKRPVTGILLRKGSIIYYLSSGVDETSHYDFEITTERVLYFAGN